METNFNDIKYLIKKYFFVFWKHIILLIILSFLGATLISFAPLFLAPALDISFSLNVEPAKNIYEINLNNIGSTLIHKFDFLPKENILFYISFLVIVFFVVGSLGVIVEFLAHLLSSWLTVNIYNNLQMDLFKHLLSLDLNFFIQNKTGELTSRFINDAGEAVMSLDSALRQALQSAIQIFIYGFLLLNTSLFLALNVFGISLLHLLINKFLKSKIQTSTSDRFDRLADSSFILNETFSNIKIIKSFSTESFEFKKFRNILKELKIISLKFWKFKHSESPLRRITDMFALGLILILAFNSLQNNSLTTSGFLLFMLVVRQTITPISQFSQALVRCYGTMGSSKRILKVLKTQTKQVEGKYNIKKFKKCLEFKNVHFSYKNSQEILKNVSFSIKKGDVVALVGPSGAGKSTIADLLLRLFEPSKGIITIDGVNIQEIKTKSYKNLFGVVPQESLLNYLSISDNIAFGRKKNIKKITKVATISNAHEFIDKLEFKYDTLIGERGVKLSGGQRQRIAIARAIYNSPQILLLDEATSSLDSDSEKKMQNAIDKILKTSTAFIIAHRFSTIKKADKIIVLNQGEIEAIGSFSYLKKNNSTFKKFYKLQNQL